MFTGRNYLYTSLLIIAYYALVLCVEAVTVNPLCPTNKIAPHKRFADWEPRGRTFGLIHGLLAPNHNYQHRPPNDLQEPLENEDPDDCGEIEDYDENDLSSVTQSQRRQELYDDNNYGYFGGFNKPSPYPQTTRRPPRLQYNPTRPPYSSGGYFGTNNYRPPSYQRPSDSVKPVDENRPEIQSTYDPYLVGGALGHIVGFSPARPTRYPQHDSGSNYPNRQVRFPASTEPPRYSNNRPSPRRFDESTIVGSFIDLFLK